MRYAAESGGLELPTIMAGFEGAEIHAHYELAQKRVEQKAGRKDQMAAAVMAKRQCEAETVYLKDRAMGSHDLRMGMVPLTGRRSHNVVGKWARAAW